MNKKNELLVTTRKAIIRGEVEAKKFAAQRTTEAATALSRKNELQVYAEIMNEALFKLTAMLYEQAADGEFANVDPVNGRILVPVPWGNDGWSAWGLRNWEAIVLRNILRQRMLSEKILALYGFSEKTNRWHMDIKTYRTYEAAFRYLQQYPITANEWRAFGDAYRRKRERKRKSKHIV